MGRFWGQMEKGGAMFTPNELVFTFGGFYVYLVKIRQEMRA